MTYALRPWLAVALAGGLLGFSSMPTTVGAPVPTPMPSPECPGSPSYDCSGIPPVICRTICNQFQSAVVRDRCTYRQRLVIERYEKPRRPGDAPGRQRQNRETEVIVEPSTRPDETGQYPVLTRIVSDTDDNGRPRSRVDPKALTILSAQGFFDLIFFPLTPERVAYYEFEPTTSPREGELAFRFRPRTRSRTVPLASGVIYLSEQGEMLTLTIDGMYNLEILDKNLKNIRSISATVDYSQFNDRFRMPTLARGEGLSDVSRFDGYFKFSFEEGNYRPVLTLPSWAMTGRPLRD